METRTLNERYSEIAHELIETEDALTDIANSQATIVYLSSNMAKKGKESVIYGECEKISDKYKWGIPADFTITVYEPNVLNFTDDQLKILIFHELLHVGIDFKEDGSESYFCRKHDYEDFKIIIDRYGTDWSKT